MRERSGMYTRAIQTSRAFAAKVCQGVCSTAGRIDRRWLIVVVLAAIVGVTWLGVAYRHWAFDFTAVARFRGDIHRNFTFGEKTIESGFLNVHENQLRDNPSRDQKLDYPPLRLLTFELWAVWMHTFHPGVDWHEEYDFHAALLTYYTFLQWMAAAAAFLIVWTWRRTCAGERVFGGFWGRHGGRRGASGGGVADGHLINGGVIEGERQGWRWTGLWVALAAFCLLWFDPGVLIIGHGWLSPNVWSIPFYLWPVLLCLWDLWFVAGVVLAIGTMLQGQLLSVVAVFVLWPIFAGQWSRCLRWVSGYVLAFALVVSPWMVSIRPDIQLPQRVVNWAAIWWVAGSFVLLLGMAVGHKLRGRWQGGWWAIAGVLAWGVLCVPSWVVLGWGAMLVVSLAAAGVVAVCFFAPWRITRYLLALVLGGCLLMCIELFGASTAWWQVGFLYGAERFAYSASLIAANLSLVITQFFEWKTVHDHAFWVSQGVLFGWPSEPIDVSIRQFTTTLFGILLVLNAWFIARQWRRRRTNLLVALVLPWVLFFTILPQMSPRYAVFAAGVGAICIGRSFGMTLASWFFSILTVLQTAQTMIGGYGSFVRKNPNWLFSIENSRVFRQLIPSLAWAEVLICLVFIYVAFDLWSGRRRRGALMVEGRVAAAGNHDDAPALEREAGESAEFVEPDGGVVSYNRSS